MTKPYTYKKRCRVFFALTVVGALLGITGMLASKQCGLSDFWQAIWAVLCLCLVFFPMFAAMLYDCKWRCTVLNPSEFGNYNVESLIEALDAHEMFGMPIFHANVRQLLTSELSKMKQSDMNLLSARQRTRLNEALLSSDSVLVVAILQALKRIGDDTSLPYVRKLAVGNWSAKCSQDVRQAAQECLEILNRRAIQGNAPKMLVRASEIPTPQEILLRPAANSTEIKPQQLLRADLSDRHTAP